MRTGVSILGLLLAISAAPPLMGQAGPQWDPTRLQVTRAELEELLEQYEAVTGSGGYSAQLRTSAGEAAELIRDRLDNGDFRVGDRIALRIEGEPDLPDTVVVQPGPVLVLPRMGDIPLAGVLRSELQDHLTQQLTRYIRDPVVTVQPMVRLAIEGEVGSPGFYVLPAEMLVSDMLMAAGGPAAGADLRKIRLIRGERVLLDGAELDRAIIDGRSLDQLNVRAGDRFSIGQQSDGSNVWGAVVRYGVPILSLLLFGIRIF
jgi:polysaccharide export outer membrane protein